MFVFLDESGRLETEDSINRPTISAVLVPEASISEATKEIINLKREICPSEIDPFNYELKSSNLLRSSAGGWKIEIAEHFFNKFLHSIEGLKVIAVVCRRPSELLPKDIKVLPLHHCWILNKVFIHMEEYVQEEEYATFIYDTQGVETDENISREFTSFIYKHHKGQEYLKRVIPFPLFGNSSLICGIELADMIAGCLSRQADLHESCDPNKKIFLSRLTRYNEEIKKVQAEMPESENKEYSIKYVRENAMEKVLAHAKQEEVEVEISPDFEEEQ